MKCHIESMEDWYTHQMPVGWESWEWNKFLCSIARIYLDTASQQTGIAIPNLIAYLTVMDGDDLQ